MKKHRWLSLLLALVLLTTLLLSGCGDKPSTGSDEAMGTSQGADGGYDQITFAFFCNLFIPQDMQMIQDALNEQLREKINAEVTLVPLSLGTYDQQMNLMISGGEKLDLYIMFGGDFSSSINQNKLAVVDPNLLAEYAPGVLDALGDYMDSVTVNGNVYGFPVNKDMATRRGVSLNRNLLDKHGLLEEAEAIQNVDDLATLFEKMSSLEPDLVMTSSQDNGKSVMESGFANFDKMGDYYGVLMDCSSDDLILENLFETDWYAQTLDYIRDWYNRGWILSDGSINPDTGINLYKSGRLFSYLGDKKPGSYVDVENTTGIPTMDGILTTPISTNNTINGVVMAIPITCEDQVPVLKFLNLLYSDPEVLNILDWGIENVHYERVPDTNTLIRYPDGVTSENDGYGLNQGWSFGNQLISYAWETVGTDDYYEEMQEFNESAVKSKAIGFIFDSTPVKSEVAALDGVLAEYRLGLENGELDPKEYLPKFQQALREAGIEKVIAEKQRQLDAWVAAQN